MGGTVQKVTGGGNKPAATPNPATTVDPAAPADAPPDPANLANQPTQAGVGRAATVGASDLGDADQFSVRKKLLGN